MGALPPKHHWRLQHGHCHSPERGPSSKATWEEKLAEETPSTMGTSISCLQDTNTLVSHECAIRGHLGHTDSRVVTTSLDLGEDDAEPFHEFNQHRMQQCRVGGEPSEPPQRVQPHSLTQEDLSPEWQTIRWLH